MMFNRFTYYLREGIESVFNHGFMSFASICIIVACLLMMGSFSLLTLNVDSIIGRLEDENEILAYVDDALSEPDARALQPRIEAIPNVTSAVFVSRDEAWESFTSSYQNSSLFNGLTSDVLPHRYVIYLEDISRMAETQQAVYQLGGISQVNAHLEISEGFVRVRTLVTSISMALVAILFIISLFIMANTIKLTTFERREEIAIMKMVGATSHFIRSPFVVEGLILAAFGSLSAYLLQYGIYRLVTDRLVAGAGLSFVTALPFSVISVPLLVAFLAVGFCVGVIGSLIAIRNYLKV